MASERPPLKVMHIISGDLWAGAEVQAYTLLSQLRHHCDLSVVLMNTGRLANELAELNIKTTILDETQFGSSAILRNLRRLMKDIEPDIIHTHRQKENILGSLANLTSVRARCLRTSHGAPEFVHKGRQRIQAALDNFVGCYLQHAIIAVSNDLRAKLETVFPARKVHVIHNGIDVEALNATAEIADFRTDKADYLHIGIIGRLESVKRVDIFLDMIPLILQDFPEGKFRFHIIGDGTLRKQLERQAHEIGFEREVEFHGHRSDMPACIRSLDAIVMCSDHEGTPMTALEAMALGTPLIAHATGGLVEILAEYPELLVKEHSPRGYAKAMRKIRPLLQEKRTRISSQYTAENNMKSTRKLYEMLMD